ncbi:MAG: fused MFS/spermidine synthase, partial [Candidatus Obscuribacterales bacterium]|nr:fused MFS/spermidine synthase [Candidatus Obscuribacterales bacterium]
MTGSNTEPGASKSFGSRFLIVALLFLLSGLSSLIYQVIWTRLLVFVFGSTTFATSTVLAVFMGGLALGSFVAGRYADNSKRPFLYYGILEAIIGIWALITPFLFSSAIPLYKFFFEPLHLQVIAFGLLRFSVAACILLLPTACMGATLPLLSCFVTKSLDEVGDRIGSLYAINTLGAVIGSVSAGFFLLPAFGLSVTTYLAAATNILLGLAVFLLSKSSWFSSPQTKTAVESLISPDLESIPEKKHLGSLPLSVKACMFTFAASGAIAMIYEVAWTRSLLMIIGSTTYAFTVMLSTFLIGIFLGSIIASRFVDRLKMPIVWFALLQICVCLAGFISIVLFGLLPYMNMVAGLYYGKSPEISMLCRFLGSGLVLVPISLCLGMIFPLAVKICARDFEKLGASIGTLYSMNTVGAIIGAFIAGFLVIPFLGSEKTLVFCSIANLILGVSLLCMFAPVRKSIKILSTFALLAVSFWSSQAPEFWDYDSLVSAQSKRRIISRQNLEKIPSLEEWHQMNEYSGKLLFYKEGKTANVAIRYFNSPPSHALITNGHIDASDRNDMENQAVLAVFPLLLSKAPKDVCLVGWGSGVTAGYALRFPLKELVCSEIEPVVVETSPFFHSVNYKPESDGRTIVEPSDGRNYLLGTARKFDALLSEPSNPWQAGVCNLFTSEYFR